MTNNPSRSLLQKLKRTGWQSWSTARKSWFRFPLCNFPPRKKTSRLNLNFSVPLKTKKPAWGWCSWYLHGVDIDEEKILIQANWIATRRQHFRLPLEYILIDDGWTLWGDWLSPDRHKFPHGLSSTVTKIKKLDLKTGVWLAPFLVDPKSKLATDHPDWLVREKNGRLFEGQKLTLWDRYLPHGKWLLDIRQSAVQKYLIGSIRYLVEDCHFDLLKLDFLYALHFDTRLSHTEADLFLRNYLAEIKKTYPHVYTIACGCPLLPAVGVVDSMRIGPDTLVISPLLRFLARPPFSRWYLSRVVLPTVSQRLWTKKIWHVDPDVFMCRKSLGYTSAQLVKFRKIITAGRGNIFLGDDLTKLPQKKIKRYLRPLFVRSV